MPSAPHIRPVELRSWEDTSRLLVFMGAGADLELLRQDLDHQALLVWGGASDQLEHLKALARQAGVKSLEPGDSPGHGKLLLIGTRAQLGAMQCLLEQAGDPLSIVWGARSERPPLPPQLSLPRCQLSLERPLVQAILNVTPDSFFDGGRYGDIDQAIRRAEELVQQGADILDIGGESTRPGAASVSEEEESARVLPLVEALSHRISVPISVDTTKAGVALRALEAGAQIINDVSGLRQDSAMAATVARQGAGLVVMHMRGNPRTMQQETRYDSLMGEVLETLEESIRTALAAGLTKDHILVDPGIGFAKTASDNLTILRELGALRCLGCPILIGASRKSFLERLFGWRLEERLFGSLGAAAAAIMAGAQVVRVHDVQETRQVVDSVWAIRQAGWGEAL